MPIKTQEEVGSATAPRGSVDYDKEKEITFWNTVKDTKSIIILQTYLDRYPTGNFVTLAKALIEQINKRQNETRADREGDSKTPPEPRGWLGVKIQNIDASVAARVGLAAPQGALVTEIITPGPAAQSDLRTNDAILSVNGRSIADARELAQQVASLSGRNRCVCDGTSCGGSQIELPPAAISRQSKVCTSTFC